jgi:hypothetical protein
MKRVKHNQLADELFESSTPPLSISPPLQSLHKTSMPPAMQRINSVPLVPENLEYAAKTL